ncbi:MAG: PilX N-terminal domain-containing pilus assembly protein [Pseudomonadota bacterium]
MKKYSTHLTPPQTPHTQRGVALVVSLMMLVAITLIGVAVMNSSRLEWLMAANSQFQTSTYTQAEAALRAGEQAIIQNTCAAVGGTPQGQQTWPDSNNCRPATFGWPFADQFYNTDPTNPLSNSALPPGTNLHAANTWANGSFISAAAPGGGRYAVVYRGCTFIGSAGPCENPPSTANTMSTFTYEVWAYASPTDTKGAARIVQSTYVMLVNWSNAIWPLGSDAPLPVGACIGPLSNPCGTRDDHTEFRRVGYVEIN